MEIILETCMLQVVTLKLYRSVGQTKTMSVCKM